MPAAEWPCKIMLVRSQSWLTEEKLTSYGRGVFTYNARDKNELYPAYTVKDLCKDVAADENFASITTGMALGFVNVWKPEYQGDMSKYKENEILPEDSKLERTQNIYMVMQVKQETPRKKK